MSAPEADRPPLVLFADDEPEVRDFVADVLTEAGFTVLTLEDGGEVPARAIEQRPSVIIVDVMMPGMDGYTVLTRLRGHPATEKIPVIVLTGRSETLFRTLSAGVGAVAHLTKPVSARQLVGTVRQILSEPRQ